jgi:hypothetical protein
MLLLKSTIRKHSNNTHLFFFTRGFSYIQKILRFGGNLLSIAMDEFIPIHPDFRPFKLPELTAFHTGSIVGIHQPPREKVFPELAKFTQRAVVGQNGKTKTLHHALPASMIGG